MQPIELDSNYLEFSTTLASQIEQFLTQTYEVDLMRAGEDFGHIVYLFGQNQLRRYAERPSSDEPGARQMHIHREKALFERIEGEVGGN